MTAIDRRQETRDKTTTPPVLVIGIGNEYACDDAVGLFAVRGLRDQGRKDFATLEHSGEGASLLDTWQGAGSVIIIDAMRSGSEPGRVFRYDASLAPLPARPFRASTHAVGLYEAVELARSLKQLPKRLIVYGVEGQNFTAGSQVSPSVRRAIAKLIVRLLGEIERLR